MSARIHRSRRGGKRALAATLAALLATPAAAQETGWHGKATLYGWLPTINGAQEGPDGEPLVDLPVNDVLSRLDMAAMGTFELRKDKFSLLLDAVYVDLSNDAEWVQQRVKTQTSTKVGMYTVAAAYRLHDTGQSFVDGYAGGRFFDVKMNLGIATDRRGREREIGLDWSDAIVGLRGGMTLNDRWSLNGFADVGGFDGSSDLSWEVYGGANYAFNDSWQGVLGYRYLSIVYQASDRARLDIDIQGPVLGVSYHF